MAYFNSLMDLWTIRAAVSGAGQAAVTVSKAAGATGVRHVAKRAIVSFAAGDTASGALQVNLRDGATGAGTVLMSWVSSLPANVAVVTNNSLNNGVKIFDEDNLNLVGTAATAMTIESTGAAADNTATAVNLIGYDLALKPVAVPGFSA